MLLPQETVPPTQSSRSCASLSSRRPLARLFRFTIVSPVHCRRNSPMLILPPTQMMQFFLRSARAHVPAIFSIVVGDKALTLSPPSARSLFYFVSPYQRVCPAGSVFFLFGRPPHCRFFFLFYLLSFFLSGSIFMRNKRLHLVPKAVHPSSSLPLSYVPSFLLYFAMSVFLSCMFVFFLLDFLKLKDCLPFSSVFRGPLVVLSPQIRPNDQVQSFSTGKFQFKVVVSFSRN